MHIEALVEPISLSTGEPAGGGAEALGQPHMAQIRDNAAGPPRSFSSDAPVTVAELVGIDGCNTPRAVQKRAALGFYGTALRQRPFWIFALDRLPAAIRTEVLAKRRRLRVEDRRELMESSQKAAPVYHLPAEMFNEDELEEARQRADFVIEVDTAMRDRKYRNQDECFMGIVGREWRTMQSGCKGSKYPLLVAVWCADGRGTDGWNAARKAFFRWRKTLAEWSTRENPRHNYHVLAPHHRFSMPNQGAPECQ